MYLKENSKDFLMLIQPSGTEGLKFPIKAIVRKVSLRQLGHWMMGTARIYGQSVTVSGSYGSDGLILGVHKDIYEKAKVYLPAWLKEKWNKGGGWNSAGSEGPEMRQWALENIKELKK